MLRNLTAREVSFSTIAVLVPCWQPGPELGPMVAELLSYGFGKIVVVADGVDDRAAVLFEELAKMPGLQVLWHAVNLGKGRALKTGFNAILAEHLHIETVVTADADGQHRVADIVAVARATLSTAGPVLGVRCFDGVVPMRSRIGNGLTRRIFSVLTGASVADTQTGLRAVSRALLPELVQLPGERYEYEMTMLAHLCRNGQRPVEVPIATVYVDGNRSSHFDPVRDSMRISFVLLRFYSSSLIAAAIDFMGFAIAFAASGNLLLSVAVGRLSSFVNFALNRRFVFHSRLQVAPALGRYYVLAVGIAAMSYVLIRMATVHLHWNVFVAKVTFDVLLSLVSFSVQRMFVFGDPETATVTSRRAASER